MHSNTTLPVGRGILYILLAGVAWGTGGAVAAVLYETSDMGPLAVSFWRFAIALPVLALAHLARRRRPVARQGWRQVVATGVGLAVYQTAYFAAVAYAGLAVATVVTLGAGPILIAVGARLTLGERLGRRGTVTTGLALAGLLLLVAGGGASSGSAPALGLACALFSAAGYAVVTLLNRSPRFTRPELPHDDGGRLVMGQVTENTYDRGEHTGVDDQGDRGEHASADDQVTGGDRQPGGIPATVGAFAVGLLCLLPLALAEGPLPTSGNLVVALALLAYLGLVPTALAYDLFFAGLAVVRATTTAILTLVEPLAAAVIAVLWLDEHLTPAMTAGSLLLAVAVLALTLTERRATPTHPTPAPRTLTRTAG
ncbi:DMT family transporter [Asanoa siamensis]|uniref:Membrane protein n=1 Tax=Asanoa siamensis TaxID=926357 RepID=A0ABQ4CZ89_9ACTN|nr:DMT family transporter [Asanoa siamensis]GIF76603.1 membrane protein [Asanoa siamensis]